MIELMFTMGQVAAAMLVIYGAMLSIGMAMPQHRNFQMPKSALLLKHAQNDA